MQLEDLTPDEERALLEEFSAKPTSALKARWRVCTACGAFQASDQSLACGVSFNSLIDSTQGGLVPLDKLILQAFIETCSARVATSAAGVSELLCGIGPLTSDSMTQAIAFGAEFKRIQFVIAKAVLHFKSDESVSQKLTAALAEIRVVGGDMFSEIEQLRVYLKGPDE